MGGPGTIGDIRSQPRVRLKKCQVLGWRGLSPQGGVRGDAWSVRQYLRDGAATAEQLAEAYGLRPEFIAAVAGTR